jgi:hypothetical protein
MFCILLLFECLGFSPLRWLRRKNFPHSSILFKGTIYNSINNDPKDKVYFEYKLLSKPIFGPLINLRLCHRSNANLSATEDGL